LSTNPPAWTPQAVRALVLAGGSGTRISPVIGDLPKVLAPIGGRVFIEFLLDQLKSAGLSEVVLLTGRGSSAVEQHLATGTRFGIHVRYSYEPTPLGTAGAIRLAATRFPADAYLVLNGDSYLDVGLDRVVAWHASHRSGGPSLGTIVVTPTEDLSRFGEVELDERGFVTRFAEKTAKSRGLMNAGIYVLDAALVDAIPVDRAVSLERETFPRLVGMGLRGLAINASFADIGIAQSYLDLSRQPPAFLLKRT
jgi:NDP-sugar pyrophosphorylase family protein